MEELCDFVIEKAQQQGYEVVGPNADDRTLYPDCVHICLSDEPPNPCYADLDFLDERVEIIATWRSEQEPEIVTVEYEPRATLLERLEKGLSECDITVALTKESEAKRRAEGY